jgi:hypothetical protein
VNGPTIHFEGGPLTDSNRCPPALDAPSGRQRLTKTVGFRHDPVGKGGSHPAVVTIALPLLATGKAEIERRGWSQ